MIKAIRNFFERFKRYKTRWVEDLPETPERRTIYIIGGRQHPYYAAIVCPRHKCKKVIHLDIAPEAENKWRYVENEDGTLTLLPSVHVTDSPCKCHYWVKQGRIVWAEFPSLFVPAENRQ